MPELRKCHRCSQNKPLSEFSKKTKDKHSNKCLKCVRELARKNYAANPDSQRVTRERQARFRKNKEK